MKRAARAPSDLYPLSHRVYRHGVSKLELAAVVATFLLNVTCKDAAPAAIAPAEVGPPPVATSADAAPAVADPPGGFVSIISLLGDPKRYAGHRVTVTGYVRIEFEGDAVYFHKEDFDNMLTHNALWLDMGGAKTSGLKEGYAYVEGVFDPDAHGHLGLFGGTLKNITRLDASVGAAIRHPAPAGSASGRAAGAPTALGF